MSRPIKSIDDVVAMQLCTGCGICAYVEPKRFRMADTMDHGRRPFLLDNAILESGEALAVCPGAHLEHPASMRTRDDILPELLDAWGPVLAVWEGYAADPEIRFSGSSGGAATALALYGIEREGMAGALHVGARNDVPYLNETVYSKSRTDLLDRTGSRYAPASPCDSLDRIEAADGKSVFIGKPCDAAAVMSARKLRPGLDEKLGLVIAFFCAGVPSTKGTLDLLRANGVNDPATVQELRYRGKGWPGMWTAKFLNREGKQEIKQVSYADSWGFLQQYRQWRCYICPDHTGEFADIAVGDPWYRKVQDGEPGKSLIVARSGRGLAVIRAAAAAGYLILEDSNPDLLPRSQPGLMETRGAIWARLWVLRMLAAGVPRYSGFPMFKFWVGNLDITAKLKSIIGTVRRVFTKRLRRAIILHKLPGERSE